MTISVVGRSYMVDTLLPAAYAEFFGIPRRLRLKGFSTESEAEGFQSMVLDAVREKKPLPSRDSSAMPRVWEALDKAVANASEKSRPTREAQAHRLKCMVPNVPIDQVTPMFLDEVAASLRKRFSANYTNGLLALLSGSLKPFERYGLIKKPTMPFARAQNKKLDPLLPAEEARVIAYLQQAKPVCADLVALYLDTGCRKMELLDLRTRNVDLRGRRIHVDGKTGQRTIPLTDRAVEILERLTDGRDGLVFTDISHTTVRRYFMDALKAAGIKRSFTIHDLRHTFCTRLSEQGVSPFVIQRLAGHTTISTTQRYTHLNIDTLAAGIASLSQRVANS